MSPATPIANNNAPSTLAGKQARHIDVAFVRESEQRCAIDGRPGRPPLSYRWRRPRQTANTGVTSMGGVDRTRLAELAAGGRRTPCRR